MALSDYEEETMRKDTEWMLLQAEERAERDINPDFYPCPDCKLCLCCDCTCPGGPAKRMEKAWRAYDAENAR